MSHRVSVFLCSEGDGVTHSTSRDSQNSHVTGELWPSLSAIFQFLILSLLRMPGEGEGLYVYADHSIKGPGTKWLVLYISFVEKFVYKFPPFLHSCMIHSRNALNEKQLFVIRLLEKNNRLSGYLCSSLSEFSLNINLRCNFQSVTMFLFFY